MVCREVLWNSAQRYSGGFAGLQGWSSPRDTPRPHLPIFHRYHSIFLLTKQRSRPLDLPLSNEGMRTHDNPLLLFCRTFFHTTRFIGEWWSGVRFHVPTCLTSFTRQNLSSNRTKPKAVAEFYSNYISAESQLNTNKITSLCKLTSILAPGFHTGSNA